MTQSFFGVLRPAARGAAMAATIAVLLSAAGCQTARTPPPPRGPLIVAPSACADFTITIYFASGSTRLGREADALLTAAGARTRSCSITGVRVRGLADAPGGRDVNLALSKQRAEAVTHALHRNGFNQVEFQVTAVGDAPVDPAGGDTRLLRRRVDVEIHLGPP